MTKRQEEKGLNRQATLFEERVKTGQFIGSNIKFADFVETWFKDYAEKQLRPKTLLGYRKMAVRTNAAIGHNASTDCNRSTYLNFIISLSRTAAGRYEVLLQGHLRGLLKDNGLKRKSFRNGQGSRSARSERP